MKYRKTPARLAMQDGNGDTREGNFTRRNLTNPNVCRKLFVDDETDNERPENRQGLDDNRTNQFFEETRNNLEKAKERWNFDFENERPLPGKYDWVKLDKDGKEVSSIVTEKESETRDDRTSRETNELPEVIQVNVKNRERDEKLKE